MCRANALCKIEPFSLIHSLIYIFAVTEIIEYIETEDIFQNIEKCSLCHKNNPLGMRKIVSLDFEEELAREGRQGNFKFLNLLFT